MCEREKEMEREREKIKTRFMVLLFQDTKKATWDLNKTALTDFLCSNDVGVHQNNIIL